MLRVGIVHGRRIVEERLLARTGDVTIGTSPQEHVHRPVGRRARALASVRGARRPPHPPPRGRHGRAHRRRRRRDQHRRARRGRAARPIPLSDRARGKVTVGDTTVLFQLLRPPAPQPRPQLPFSIRRRVSAEIDRFFTIVLAFTVLLHVAVVVYLRQVDWPRRPSIEEVPDRFVRQIVHTPRPTPPPAAAPTTVADAHAARAPAARARRDRGADARDDRRSARRARGRGQHTSG